VRRIASCALTGALLAGLALGATSAAQARTAGPALRVHAIFGGGRGGTFHAGEVLFVDVRNASGRKLTQICWSPAPIARPECSTSRTAALPAGPATVAATLDDGTTLTGSFAIHAAATRVGGPRAVPATIRCDSVRVFGNYDRRRGRSIGVRATLSRGARVGLYNRIAPGKIFMWDYATNIGGFASERCAQPGGA